MMHSLYIIINSCCADCWHNIMWWTVLLLAAMSMYCIFWHICPWIYMVIFPISCCMTMLLLNMWCYLLWLTPYFLLLFCFEQTEEEIPVSGYCHSRILLYPGANLADQQDCTTCYQDNHIGGSAKQCNQFPENLQSTVQWAETRLHHR